MRRIARSLLALHVLGATTLLLAGCGDSTSPTVDIRNYITGLTTSSGQVTATFRAGNPPASGSGPSVVATGTSAMILGGGALRSLTSSSAFTRVIVAVSGVSGYWELTLSNAVTAQDVVLSLAQEMPSASFTVEYAAGTSAAVGAFDTEPVSILTVGTGEIQVSVSWNAESDVDLHLVEPTGTEIYYGNSSATSGGTLDLDSNAGCSIDGTKNENITWPSGTAPRGTYTVRVDYWSSCGVSSTNYVVSVRVKGRAATTHSGTFTGSGDNGGAGSGVLVTTFTY